VILRFSIIRSERPSGDQAPELADLDPLGPIRSILGISPFQASLTRSPVAGSSKYFGRAPFDKQIDLVELCSIHLRYEIYL
jgi:hypothetical protein